MNPTETNVQKIPHKSLTYSVKPLSHRKIRSIFTDMRSNEIVEKSVNI